jgi:hypothetical protein
MLSFIYYYAECHYGECRFAEFDSATSHLFDRHYSQMTLEIKTIKKFCFHLLSNSALKLKYFTTSHSIVILQETFHDKNEVTQEFDLFIKCPLHDYKMC